MIRHDEDFNDTSWWGEAWVARVAKKLGVSISEAARMLERGGRNGTPMNKEDVYKILN